MMRRLAAIVVMLSASLVVQAVAAQDGVRVEWERSVAPGNQEKPDWFGASTERGLAFGRVNDGRGILRERVYVVSRSSGTAVRIMDASDGSDIGTLTTSGVSGGWFVLNDVDVSTDGVIIACNMTLNAESTNFRCYSWNTEQATPTRIIDYQGAEGERVGDKITVVGSKAQGTLTVWAPVASTNKVYRFDVQSNGDVEPSVIMLTNRDGTPVSDMGASASAAPLSPGEAAFYLNSNAARPRLFEADGRFQGEVGAAGTGTSAIRYFEMESQAYIATYVRESNALQNAAIVVDVTGGPSGASLVGSTPSLGSADDGGNIGDIDYQVNGNGTVTLYVLVPNNGVGAYTVTLIEIPNRAPVAEDDQYSVEVNTALTVSAPGVLINDSDLDGDDLIAVQQGQPSHGTLTFEEDGSFEYVPDQGFTGEDVFGYVASDGTGDSEVAFVYITVEGAANTQPVANDDAVETDEDTPVLIDVLGNDEDDDGDELTITDVSAPDHGTAAIEDQQIRYSPDTDFSGDDQFTYTISDGRGGTAEAEVAVTVRPVNDAPSAFARVAPENGATVPRDSARFIWTRATDLEGDAVSYQLSITVGETELNYTMSDTTRLVDFTGLGLAQGVLEVNWTIEATDGDEVTSASNGEGTFSLASGVAAEDPSKPASFALDQNFPNPFRSITAIRFGIATPSHVQLTVYDALGREVAVLLSEHRAPGHHEVAWDAQDYPSGIYLCRLEAGSYTQTRRMLLLR